jgi:hypothetical protein
MSLVGEWEAVESTLPAGWGSARLELTLTEGDHDQAVALLGPAQPQLAAPSGLRFTAAHDGSGTSPGAVKRLLGRLDDAGIGGTLTVLASEVNPITPRAELTTLAESWDAALATLPADWSDLVGEIELISSDYLEKAALQLAPINPRLVAQSLQLRFRCAARFGYGASPGMVRRCLERCDAIGIRGTVRILRALSDSRPVATQGPVWQMGGRTV